MGWKRDLAERLVGTVARTAPWPSVPPEAPEKILVLRNNDIGDLLVVTPVFAALRQRFPQSEILAGIGDWNRPVLEGNPNVDRIVPVNAPWHNQQVHPGGTLAALRYIYQSDEANRLAREQCAIGLDVLGSLFGSLLFVRAGIPYRVGVRGYAGGNSAAQQAVEFSPDIHVGQQALNQAALIGSSPGIENRPQLFLPDLDAPIRGRIVLAPGGGYAAKRWPVERFCELARQLRDCEVVVIGAASDAPLAAQIRSVLPSAMDACGGTLRDAFRTIASAEVVVCNSSMAMHAAAAFRRPCVVLLGDIYPSARQHHAQWGYPETQMLGPERARGEGIAPVQAALCAVLRSVR